MKYTSGYRWVRNKVMGFMIPQERGLNEGFEGFPYSLSPKPSSICHLFIYLFDLLNTQSLNSCKRLGEEFIPLCYENIG
jgi:hypothetical protein